VTAEWFDLGQRLYAARTGEPVARLVHAPVVAVPVPVAVRARRDSDGVSVAAAIAGTAPATATGPAALDLLGSLGVTVAAEHAATLITDDPATLGLLRRLALTARRDSDQDAVAAHIAWWCDRADFPGGRAVVETLDACRARWVPGTAPEAERVPATWRRWLQVADDSVAGLLEVHDRLGEGEPLQWLDVLAQDAEYAFGVAQSEHGDGFDWRRPDSTGRAALGLRGRCDAADLFAASLLADPLARRRAVHTGHVVTGTAHPLSGKLRRVEVACGRLDARLRPGNDVQGWVGSPEATATPFSATVASATVRGGDLVLTLSGATGVGAPSDGALVTLMPAPPSPDFQRTGRRAYRALYSARRSWLTTGRTPTLTRRPVPLDVLVAGAEPS
jgi:hypothetical protein